MKSIRYSFLYALLILQVNAFGQANINDNVQNEVNHLLPWQREIPLREAAKSISIESTLNPTDPDRGAMSINNLKMNTTLWGPTNRITISLTKNDVWDRRLHEFKAPTLQEITEGAFSPANKYYVGVKEIQSYLFDKVDFIDFRILADKLIKKADPVSVFVNSKLSDDLKASMTKYLESGNRSLEQEQVLMTNLATKLNDVVGGESIYTPSRFNGIILRPNTEDLLNTKPTGTDLMTLNRYLLEDAYPKEISKRPGNSLRPLDLGWLTKEGGSVDPYRYPMRYAFPCLKPVGQIIVGIDELTGAEPE